MARGTCKVVGEATALLLCIPASAVESRRWPLKGYREDAEHKARGALLGDEEPLNCGGLERASATVLLDLVGRRFSNGGIQQRTQTNVLYVLSQPCDYECVVGGSTSDDLYKQ